MRRLHRTLPLALLALSVATVAACDNPAAPQPITLAPKTASDLSDTLACGWRGYTIIQGFVVCNGDGP